MPFDVELDDGLDLDDLFEDISVLDSNMYIADEDKAVELISLLIKNDTNSSVYFQKKLEVRLISYSPFFRK